MRAPRPRGPAPAPPRLQGLAAPAPPAGATETGCRWLALHLPALALQVFERAAASPLALAISEGERVIACNAAARAQGVRPGLGDGAAQALAGGLRILPRRPDLERAALERLAAWALAFSDRVSLDPEPARPAALVLEARGSLRLFGGAAALRQRVVEGAEALGWRVRAVLAPTPAGALVLAAAGHEGLVASQDALRRALAGLPPARLGLESRVCDDLAAMGVRSLGALLRLPRAGLAERFGPSLLQRIERLLGERADPRRPFVPPQRFGAELELPAEVEDTSALVFACHRLLEELSGFLRARQCGVQRLDWRLVHARGAATAFALGCARAEHDPAHWLALLRERLGRVRLPAPVRAVGLRSDRLLPFSAAAGELALGDSGGGRAGAAAPDSALLDRLHARLGARAVRALATAADHRPERAWRWVSPMPGSGAHAPGAGAAAAAPRCGNAERPLWLLPQPRPLESCGGRPWLDGPLTLGSCCERIETGWWDGFEVARDYYVATTVHGERLWVYREMRGARRWYLHGLMGCTGD